MTDQTIPDVTDDERSLARKWAEDIVTGLSNARMRAAARVILNAVPAPPRPTLADMTPDERNECKGMQADLAQGDRVVILDGTPDSDGLVQVLEKSLDVYRPHPDEVTPRPDIPRLEWPGTEKPAPAPSLPEGWRLADHKDHGRVIVTDPTPNRDGYVYCVFPSGRDSTGFDWHPYDPEALTYLDTDQEADTVPESTLAVGSVWDDADALARACEETGRDQITVTDRNGDVSVWDGRRDDWRSRWPIPKSAPFTILHAGKEADQ